MTQKITVAHFMPWSGIGGVEIATLRMVEATKDRFHHVAFCLPDATALQNAFQEMGVHTVTFTPPEPSLRHGARFYRQSRALARQINEVGAAIVHFSETKAAENSSLAAALARCRLICHVRNTYSEMDMRQRLPLRPIDRFIFVSGEARRQFAIPLPERKVKVIYDAIEIPALDVPETCAAVRRELGIPAGATVVGMVARVNPQKDYDTLAAASVEVLRKHPSTRFLIVGDNALVPMNREHYAALAQKLRNLNVDDSFIFTGHRDDVPRLIAAMDISILSSHREGFGLCIAESMALKKPVVATAVGGLLEVVTHGVTGYLHAHGNAQELAGWIDDLIERPDHAQQLAQAGFEHVRQDYSRQKFVEEISLTYQELCPAQ